MRSIFAGTIALIAAGLGSTPASAGVYGDDATRCLAKSVSESDQIALVKWIFSAMAMHPSIKQYANISAEQKVEFDSQVNAIVTRLLTQSCRKETVAALRYEGSSFLETSFRALGEIAMGGLTTNPDVAAGLTSWATNMDKEAFAAVAAEAGRPLPPPTK
jgi:hypothetical protein